MHCLFELFESPYKEAPGTGYIEAHEPRAARSEHGPVVEPEFGIFQKKIVQPGIAEAEVAAIEPGQISPFEREYPY